MKLNIDDRVVDAPTPADIETALAAPSFADDWLMSLEDREAILDAMTEAGGSFLVTFTQGADRRRGYGDTAQVKALFMACLQRHANWQDGFPWQEPARTGRQAALARNLPSLTGRNDSEPPVAAIVVMVLVIALVALMFKWPGLAYAVFPFAHSDWFWISLIFLPMIVLVLLAVASKGLAFRRAASWQATTGRILSSKIAQRPIKIADSPGQIENYAAITYEFATPTGRKVRGSRIGIGDDYRNVHAAPTVKRYPVGANVTVFYDPDDPRNCVLERGSMKGIEAKGCVMALVELGVAGGILWALIARGPAAVRAWFPHAGAEIVVMAFGIGVFLCMLAYAQWRISRKAAGWPIIAGKVTRSEVETFEERDSSGSLHTRYRPVVEYAYTVAGAEYSSAQVRLNLTTATGSRTTAERQAQKYPEGAAVSVLCDPDNPSNAVLENPGSTSWYLLTLAAAAFIFAASQTHAFG